MIKSLSVFFPAYNEEGNIESTVEKSILVLKGLNLKNWEVIIVNDGSKDATGKIADKLASRFSQVRVIHQQNGGYGEAVKTGFYNAKYEWIVYTDSDAQFDFSEIDRFLEKTSKFDAIWGYRMKRADNPIRLVFSKGWAVSLFMFFGLWLKDVDCGFKMIKKEVFQKIDHLESTRGGMVNAELAIKIKQAGLKIAQVGVNHYPRNFGKPTGANLKVVIRSYLDLLKLWRKLVLKIR